VPLYNSESINSLITRWQKLDKVINFIVVLSVLSVYFGKDFKQDDGKYDISKIPDIYDYIKYDMLHNRYTNQTSRSCTILTCSIIP